MSTTSGWSAPHPPPRRPMRTLAKAIAWTIVAILALQVFCVLIVATGGFAVAPLILVFLAVRESRKRKRMRNAEHAAAVKGVRKLRSRIRRANRRP